MMTERGRLRHGHSPLLVMCWPTTLDAAKKAINVTSITAVYRRISGQHGHRASRIFFIRSGKPVDTAQSSVEL